MIRRRYINVLKSYIKINMKQVFFMHFKINLNEIMSLTKNFETVNKILYIFRLFEQERQNSNTTTVFVINNKIDENFNIIIKKFKCYNCNKTVHKVFVCFNEHVSDQDSSD